MSGTMKPFKLNDNVELTPFSTKPEVEVIENQYQNRLSVFIEINKSCNATYSFELDDINQLNELKTIKTSLQKAYQELRSYIVNKYQQKDKDEFQKELDKRYSKFNKVGDRLSLLLENALEDGNIDEFWELLFEPVNEKIPSFSIRSSLFQIPFEFLTKREKDSFKFLPFLAQNYKFSKRFKGTSVKKDLHLNLINPKVTSIFSDFGEIIEKEINYYRDLHDQELLHLDDKCGDLFESLEDLFEYMSNSKSDILHIACHVDNSDKEFKALSFNQFSVTSTDFKCVEGRLPYKLVFLNGCKTDGNDFKEMFSFAEILNKSGVLSVITVDIEIPDKIAATFSTKLISKIITNDQNKGIDEIMYEISKDIHKTIGDIGGYFYSIYGLVK